MTTASSVRPALHITGPLSVVEAGLADHAEAVVREAVRQLRMLGVAEREATLRLLETQVKP